MFSLRKKPKIYPAFKYCIESVVAKTLGFLQIFNNKLEKGRKLRFGVRLVIIVSYMHS